MRTKNETIEGLDHVAEVARLWKRNNRNTEWAAALNRMLEEIQILKGRYWLDKRGDIPCLFASHKPQQHSNK
jgi:hypothetical protein